jgi:hypothetical protein
MKRNVLRLIYFLLIPTLLAAAPGQTTPPTPASNPIDTCFKDLVECVPDVIRTYGVLGGIAVGVIVLLIYLVVTPAGELLQGKVREFLQRFRLFRPAKPSPAEMAEREERYIKVLYQSPQLDPEADPATQIATYLDRLRKTETPLRPGEESQFISLEGGLSFDLRPRLGLALPSQDGSGRGIFTEQRTFPDLTEAMSEIDPATGSPYPAFVLLGEPGSGKSTLMRKLAREALRRRLEDPEALLPVFVSLSDHKSGTPLNFLRRHWQNEMGYDGIEDALSQERIWLFADGLNEMDRKGYEERKEFWRQFLGKHFQPGGNRALVACRLADYGEGVGLRARLLIHPMDEKRIKDFLSKRIPGRDQVLWEQLENDHRNGRGDLYTLATVPFWLVLIAGMARPEGLPRNRAELADLCISKWLDYEADPDRPGRR